MQRSQWEYEEWYQALAAWYVEAFPSPLQELDPKCIQPKVGNFNEKSQQLLIIQCDKNRILEIFIV